MHIAPSSRTLADQAADARTRADMVESEVRELRATIMRETLASRMDLVRSGGSASIEPRMTAGGGSGGYGNATRTWARDQRRARGGSAQSFLTRTTHDALRRDSQDLDRNNPLAQALVSRSADMIGSSFSLQVRSQNGKFNAAAEQFIGDWWSRMDGTGIDVTGRMSGDDLMHDMIRTGWLVEGDRLNLLVQSGDVVGVQMIESERLRNPYNMPDMESADGGGGLLGGVEVDRFGKAVAYHVSDWNPIGGGTFAQVQTRRINAADAIFVRNPLRFRAGQVRGEPALASVIDRFEQLDSVAESVRIAYWVAACTAALVTSEFPGEDQGYAAEYQDTTIGGQAVTRPFEQLAPGGIQRIRTGETVTQIAPQHPSANYKDLVYLEILQICASVGLPAFLVMLDLSNVNYSSARIGIVSSWRGIQRSQRYAASICRRLSTWRLAVALRRGELDGYSLANVPDQWDRHVWSALPAPDMDPIVAMQRLELGKRSLIMSEREIADERGVDFDTLKRQQSEESKLNISLGLPPAAQVQAGPGAKESTATERDDGTEVAGGKKGQAA